MTSIPWELFSDYVKGDDIKKSGVGMFFLPQVPPCLSCITVLTPLTVLLRGKKIKIK
jgi:hypothetical protein